MARGNGPITPSTYHVHRTRETDSEQLPVTVPFAKKVTLTCAVALGDDFSRRGNGLRLDFSDALPGREKTSLDEVWRQLAW